MTRTTIILLFTIVFAKMTLVAQTVLPITKDDSISFSQLSDSLIRREVSIFTIKGTSLRKTDTLYRAQLIEIPVRKCTDKEVHLSRSTFTSQVSIFIAIYFREENAGRILNSISLVTHSHFWVEFPNSAFQGLSQNNPCNFNGDSKKAEFFSPYYKAFYSTDKRRVYIYMQGGTDSHKYEVTWIIVNDKYYARIIDSIS